VVSSSKPNEFRENADECLGWAKTACSDRERQIFLQMAEAWLEAAARRDVARQKSGPGSTDDGRARYPNCVRPSQTQALSTPESFAVFVAIASIRAGDRQS
jgi:hypothetical protein